jgi:hypothetical protein
LEEIREKLFDLTVIDLKPSGRDGILLIEKMRGLNPEGPMARFLTGAILATESAVQGQGWQLPRSSSDG